MCPVVRGDPYISLAPCPGPRSEWVGNVGPAVRTRDVGVDALGNVVMVGDFAATPDFDPTDGVYEEITSMDGNDVYVTKLLPDGTHAWTRAISSPGYEAAWGVAFGEEGTVLLSGVYEGTVDFDPTDGVDERTAAIGFNAFLTKLGPDGAYRWTVTFGQGNGGVSARRVARDGDGNLLVVGSFFGTADFDPGKEIDQRISTWPGRDIFVSKFAQDGAYLWTRTFGGTGFNRGTDVAVDPIDDIFVTGTFRGTVDFDPGPDVDYHTAVGPIRDIYITKLHADGSYGWTRTSPAAYPGQDGILAVDEAGDVYFSGAFRDSVDFDPTDGVDWRVSTDGTPDIFVTKLHGDGSYGWTWTAGGPGTDLAYAVTVDTIGNVFATGAFRDTVDFDPGPGVDEYTSAGGNDIFVTRLGADGDYHWTRTLGGPYFGDGGRHVTVDLNGGVVVTGTFTSIDFAVDLDPSCVVREREVHDPFGGDTFINKLVCIEPTPDSDGDGDVDLRDFAALQTCYTGRDATECGTGCTTLDLNQDGAIDTNDLTAFTFSLDGP